MASTLESRTVTRRGRRVYSWRLIEDGTFACGHSGTVTTLWHVEPEHATVGDATGPASAEVIMRFGRKCPNCIWEELGGPK